MIFIHHYPEYESNFGIDHSRIVDLLQVFETIPTIDVSFIGNKWWWISLAVMRDPNSGGLRAFNMDVYGIWGTKTEIGDRELWHLFLAFGSGYLCRGNPPLGREGPQNPGEIPDTPHGLSQKFVRVTRAARANTCFYCRKHAPAYAISMLNWILLLLVHGRMHGREARLVGRAWFAALIVGHTPA